MHHIAALAVPNERRVRSADEQRRWRQAAVGRVGENEFVRENQWRRVNGELRLEGKLHIRYDLCQ